MKVGQRFLYRLAGEVKVREGWVKEFSPSEKYVSLSYEWFRAEEVMVLEDLPAPEDPMSAPAPNPATR